MDRFGPTQPVYRFLIHQIAMLLFKCFCLYYRFERIFLTFLWFILMNAQMSTQLYKNSFKSMSCSSRINQFTRNFLCQQAPGCIQIYSFKSMVVTLKMLPMYTSRKGSFTWRGFVAKTLAVNAQSQPLCIPSISRHQGNTQKHSYLLSCLPRSQGKYISQYQRLLDLNPKSQDHKLTVLPLCQHISAQINFFMLVINTKTY